MLQITALQLKECVCLLILPSAKRKREVMSLNQIERLSRGGEYKNLPRINSRFKLSPALFLDVESKDIIK